jgi:hypothetical protein
VKLTENQQKILDLHREGLDGREIARRLGHSSNSHVCRTLQSIKLKAMQEGADPGYFVKGKSTLYDSDGNVKIEWIKTEKEKERLRAALKEAVEAFKADIPAAKPIKPKGTWDKDLLNCHILTDYHLGMYAWPDETGNTWNLDLAEDLVYLWFADAIRRAPKAETGLLAQLGDFLHYDSMVPITPTGGHIQDTDSRYALVVRTAIRAIRRLVRAMLKKYNKVHILMAEGNHDLSSSVWLRELFAVHYEKESRVIVDQTVEPYYVIEHGDTSLFFHHGHKRKPANVDSVFVGRNRKVYGRTKHSYAHLGHMHHLDSKETNLMVVEQHRTMAARDAYSTRAGFGGARSAACITYHKEFGEVGRISTTYEMIREDSSKG